MPPPQTEEANLPAGAQESTLPPGACYTHLLLVGEQGGVLKQSGCFNLVKFPCLFRVTAVRREWGHWASAFLSPINKWALLHLLLGRLTIPNPSHGLRSQDPRAQLASCGGRGSGYPEPLSREVG